MKPALFIALLCSLLTVSCNNDIYLETPETDAQGPKWTWIPYNSDLLRITGRGNYEKDDYVILSWSSSAVTVGFVGTALEMKIWTNSVVYLDVFVDKEEDPSSEVEYINSGDSSSMVPVVSGLSYGPHVVTLYKRSESNVGDLYFYGFRVLGRAEKNLLPSVPKRKIEFIGNSITCGADVLIPDPTMDSKLTYESSYYSYAGQTAKILNAEPHVICCSGHGLYVNIDGSKTDLLPVVYNKTGTQSISAVAWDHRKWHPDIIVINLGTNDIASGQSDSAHFVNAAVDFIRDIRSYHAKAKIVLLDGPMLTGEYRAKCRRYLNVVKKVLRSQGEKGLYRFSLEPKGDLGYGIYYHPVKEEALADAESLSAWIRSEFGWK